jgi:dihydroorotate dehydrogenase electron transfer subunit
VTLLYGVRTASQLIPPELLPDNIQLLISTEDGSGGEKGLVSSLIPVFANQAERIYACGPLPMYRAISEICSKEIINKPVQISLEVRMGCGLGFCYACTIKTRQGLKQVCKDGPVFNLEDVILEEL